MGQYKIDSDPTDSTRETSLKFSCNGSSRHQTHVRNTQSPSSSESSSFSSSSLPLNADSRQPAYQVIRKEAASRRTGKSFFVQKDKRHQPLSDIAHFSLSPKPREDGVAPPLPHNPEAERSTLAAILLDNSFLNAARQIVSPSDFFSIQNQKVFSMMLGLAEKASPIDYVTLLDAFEKTSAHVPEDLAAYLSSLPNGVPRPTNIEFYAQIVREKAVLRHVVHTAQLLQEEALAAGADARTIVQRASANLAAFPDVTAPVTFHVKEEYVNAPELRFAIRNLVQLDSATIFGGLSGQAKTWVLLSIAKALLSGKGTLLWNHFPVEETAEKVIYLIPESAIGPFGHRLKLLGLMKYIENGRLLTRTLSKGPRIDLDDPRILSAAKNAHVFLDTIGRWSEGDENSAGDNQRGLASDIFGLLGVGALSAIAAHHSPKGFSKETVMSLENCLRGIGGCRRNGRNCFRRSPDRSVSKYRSHRVRQAP